MRISHYVLAKVETEVTQFIRTLTNRDITREYANAPDAHRTYLTILNPYFYLHDNLCRQLGSHLDSLAQNFADQCYHIDIAVTTYSINTNIGIMISVRNKG